MIVRIIVVDLETNFAIVELYQNLSAWFHFHFSEVLELILLSIKHDFVKIQKYGYCLNTLILLLNPDLTKSDQNIIILDCNVH